MELFALNISNFKIDGGSMFGVVPKVLWQRVYPADEDNLCPWALRSLVIKHEGRVVLIDNGFGSKQDKKILDHHHMFGNAVHRLLQSLLTVGEGRYHAVHLLICNRGKERQRDAQAR